MKRKLDSSQRVTRKSKRSSPVSSSIPQQLPLHFTTRKLRSSISRRRRLHVSPIKFSDSNFNSAAEVSCNSSVTDNFQSNRSFPALKTYSRRKQRKVCNEAIQVSETSCVESNTVLNLNTSNAAKSEVSRSSFDVNSVDIVQNDITSKLKTVFDAEKENALQHAGSVVESCAGSNLKTENITKSEVSSCSFGVNSIENVQNDAVSKLVRDFNVEKDDSLQVAESYVKAYTELKLKTFNAGKSELSSFDVNSVVIAQNDASGFITNSKTEKEISLPNDVASKLITDAEAKKEIPLQKDKLSLETTENLLGFDLACSEQLSNGVMFAGKGEEEEYMSSSSGIFNLISDAEFESSDYTPSIWCSDSGSQFSEKSSGDDSSTSPTFQLFRQFKQQFVRSSFVLKARCDAYDSRESTLLGLEDEEDEESYGVMRKRERKHLYLHDYAEEYRNRTEYGDLVVQQRLCMVHWIVEEASNKELQKETIFLGVSLLDRFLTKGYFQSMSNLQIAGIACLTLAKRIEENQPYNCVRKKTFYVGGNTYTRCEVVAMEWLVQEVLNFQCFLPTSYNFLWFYLKAAKGDENVEKTVKYLAVLALMGHQQLCFWPSTIAAALVMLASIASNRDESCHLIAAIHARQKDRDLPECIKSLEWLVKYL